jgi:benzoylformate decarboxylase
MTTVRGRQRRRWRSLVGDVGIAIRVLTELLPPSDRQPPQAHEPPPAPEPATPMSVEFVMHTLAGVLPEEALFDETASSMAKLHRYVRFSRPGGYHTSAAGGLGFWTWWSTPRSPSS